MRTHLPGIAFVALLGAATFACSEDTAKNNDTTDAAEPDGGDPHEEAIPSPPRVAAGEYHSCAIDDEGRLWCWGWNEQGQLGTGSADNAAPFRPLRVGEASDWTSVATGQDHTCAIRSDGSLWCWGTNWAGQLGNGTTDGPVPEGIETPVGEDRDWRVVAAGLGSVSCAIKADTSVWCWGNNDYLQTGRAEGEEITTPTRANNWTGWQKLSIGSYHVCALQEDGSLWCWGRNFYGQMGNSSAMGGVDPQQVGPGETWTAVAAGTMHTCAVRQDGSLWCWGRDESGQLGTGTPESEEEQEGEPDPDYIPHQVVGDQDWLTVGAGARHTCAIKQNGTLWCWGDDRYGQLGLGEPSVGADQHEPVQVGTEAGWVELALGANHTCARREDGTVRCWGINDRGQAREDGDYQQSRPMQVGTDTDWRMVAVDSLHACALKADNSLWCWGNNAYGQLGFDGRWLYHTPVAVGEDRDWAQVDVGSYHSCARKVAGSIWCWGYGGEGQLGVPGENVRRKPTRVGDSSNWKHLTLGSTHVCATRLDGTLWCWGWNASGQIGDGTQTNRDTPYAVPGTVAWSTVTTGSFHTCALQVDGSRWCWGDNVHGELGVADTSLQIALQPVQGDQGAGWQDLAAGVLHTCGLKEDQSLWCWGNNDSLQLGGTPEAGIDMVQVEPGVAWSQVSANNEHTCAIGADGSLWCWGGNRYGKLGVGAGTEASLPPTQVGEERDWSSVSVGSNDTCAIKQDGSLWCWGDNRFSQLGLGARHYPEPVEVPLQ